MMNPSASSIFLVQLVCFLVFLPISQCSSPVFFPMDEKLIEDTCRKTPNYDVCLFNLKQTGGSGIYSANLIRLADVMIDVVGLRAADALNKIQELLSKAPGDLSLQRCNKQYSYITQVIVPYSKNDIHTNPPSAVYMMHGIHDRAGKYCEDLFRGSSPLTDFNRGVQIVAAIASAIAGQLK